ncbi:IS200/IS605 family transposase [Ectobacillus antri]|uniref:IS200/IS605 family transposase n=1 Tax=Ectobacillus antri TaxID=2486280 RepID=A0ABT6H9V0_9BACI|nr:IS200/IS605 family transposase [Ectobacillus antri]MDG4658456.1 IS200/IS605 family transposase [Ectobacillus antri]MDG5755465.1 IS200/IS605 family transposase [Ectobacillus antri]
MSRTVQSNSNITFDCKYHVVFCPKYRKKVLVNPVDIRLKELFVEKANELQADILEVEIMPDHCHLLISCDPQCGIHKIVKQLKGYSSRILRTEFPHLKSRLPSLWTNSYFVATFGSVTLEVVKQYVLTQKERGG